MSVTHPYQRIPPKHRSAVFLSFLALTLVLMLVLLRIDAPLQTDAAPMGIVSYELAGSVDGAQRILDSWDPTARLYAAFSLGLDYSLHAGLRHRHRPGLRLGGRAVEQTTPAGWP